MNILSYFAAAIATAICAMYIKQVRADWALCVSLAGVLLLLNGVIPRIGYIVADIQRIASDSSFPGEYITPVMKIIGISYVAQLAADVCKDAGETAISSHVETLGKIAVAFIALPVITEVFELIMGLVE
ncbi:MAG: hypothetical protein IJ300_14750 [Clostridia bacterium]|nr:hypothetical protein [Clostridia bacterium]